MEIIKGLVILRNSYNLIELLEKLLGIDMFKTLCCWLIAFCSVLLDFQCFCLLYGGLGHSIAILLWDIEVEHSYS